MCIRDSIRTELLKERESAAQGDKKKRTKKDTEKMNAGPVKKGPDPQIDLGEDEVDADSLVDESEEERRYEWSNWDYPGASKGPDGSDDHEIGNFSEEEYERPLKEVSGNRTVLPRAAEKGRIDSGMANEDDEDEAPIARPAMRRNVRAGFIVESDSE